MKYIVVGGVAGGAATAARIRRNDENGEILILKGESIFPMQIAVFLIISGK